MSLLLVVAMSVSMFAGCGSGNVGSFENFTKGKYDEVYAKLVNGTVLNLVKVVVD